MGEDEGTSMEKRVQHSVLSDGLALDNIDTNIVSPGIHHTGNLYGGDVDAKHW